ncbi:MAG: hypothetical protein RL660_661 [Bacteroidota bacterium]|jgi:putative membrane protein
MKKSFKLGSSNFLFLNCVFVLYATYTFFASINTQDWLIENILTLGFLVYLFYQRISGSFRFSAAAYLCMYTFLCLHEWGAQFTYSEHPFGEVLRQALHLQRNGYDRLVHTCFGLLMYLPAVELLHYSKRMPLQKARITALQHIFILATVFELIEFAVGYYIFPNSIGHTYVGTQGDIWDAHKDIVVALIGSGFAAAVVGLFSRTKEKMHNALVKS